MFQFLAVVALFVGTSAFSPKIGQVARQFSLNAQVESFKLHDGRSVQVFDGDYGKEICADVVATSKAAISKKGSFSLCIPGGSVVAALKDLPKDLDYSKWHIFFANERIGENKCYEGALKSFATDCKIPLNQIHGVGSGSAADVAAKYELLMKSDKSIDNSGKIPSVDMILLGTGDDGHCGSLYPNSPEIMETGKGKVVLGIDGKQSIAVTMDLMNASKRAIVSAAAAIRAPMVERAFAVEKETGVHYDCPAAMVKAAETVWFVDTASIEKHKNHNNAKTLPQR